MRKIFTSIVCATLISGTAVADHLSDRLTFSAWLNGAQQNPAVTTSASGVGTMMLNSTHDTLWINIALTGLGNNVTGIHIHKGVRGTNGSVVIDLGSKLDKNIIRTYLTGANLANNRNDLFNDLLYLNVHTTAHPNGEIRGQIMLDRDYGVSANLDGVQAANPLVQARGTLAMGMNHRMDSVWFWMQTTGLSGKITGIHIHQGGLLQNGGVILGLDAHLRADSMGLAGGRMVTAAERDTLMKYIGLNQAYINVHTATYPNGEIRGQLAATDLRFDAVVDVASITAGGGSLGTPSNAWGVAACSLSSDFTSFKFDVVVNDLSSAPTAAHFHNAAPNASGGVVKDLTITNNRITGTWTSTDGTQPLTSALVRELLMGNIYLVVHTSANGNGEIRGNVTRLAHEGFICEIDGAQASTGAAAMGAGIATYDRSRTNMRFMFAVDGLSGAISDVHLHKAVKGQSGGVVYSLMSSFANNSGFGYWYPFGNSNSIAFRTNDSIYINIHTIANPTGEVRGQLMRNYRISSETSAPTGIKQVNASQLVKVFPNPMGDAAIVRLNNAAAEARVELIDITGKKVAEGVTTNGEYVIPSALLANGVYVLRVTSEGNSTSLKLIK